MIARKSQIDALLLRAQNQLADITEEYKSSLANQNISDLLKVDIKNFCENLRSVLDYLSHEIHELYCSSSSNSRFYFPILPDNSQFTSCMNQWFPSLSTKNIAMYSFLESIQPYQPNYKWLGDFNKVNNENKHGSLVQQTRKETIKITAKSTLGGGSVTWVPKSVKFGLGVYINGVPVNPATQMPIPSPTQTVTKTIWVDFIFEGINQSALKLLNDSFAGISNIYKKLEAMI